MEDDVAEGSSCRRQNLGQNNTSYRPPSNSQQQPGQYLCVDTKKQLESPEIQTLRSSNLQIQSHGHNKCLHNPSSNEKQLTAIHRTSVVQPDSLCKLKTILAVDYVRDVLELTNHTPVPVQKLIPLKKLKKGKLRPLLSVNQLDKPQIATCLGIQNDRHKKTILLQNERELSIESPVSTRFSSANKTTSGNDCRHIDLRKLSLVDQNGIAMDDKLFSRRAEGEFDDFRKRSDDIDDCNFFGDDVNNVGQNNGANIDQKMNSNRENRRNNKKEINYDIDHDIDFTEKKEICQDFELKTPENEELLRSTNKKTLATMVNPVKPSPDLDNIQVKDIWKALVDGGYDISREEVSKYKRNTTKSPVRIKSAPTRRRSSQTSYVSKDISRPRSSYPGKDREGFFEDVSMLGKADNLAEGNTVDEIRVGATEGLFAEGNSKEKDDKDSTCQENIEVVAQKKSFSKLPRAKNARRPLVAPLNFKINTRPKLGHCFYFAYGLNMNYKRLEIQLRCKSRERYWGLLFGFKLIFNKKGSLEGGVGFPNIVADPGFSVEGCVYELSQDCLQLLNTSIGFPKHYARLVLPVWLCNSSNPDDVGVAQHCVPAIVYVAQNNWVVSDPSMLDNSFTFKQCLLGTDLLTPNYQDYLSSLQK